MDTPFSMYQVGAEALLPPRDISVSQWADENVVLTGSGSAERGQWHTRPYQREPMDVLSPSHPSKQVVLMSAAQMLKTSVNFLGYIADVDPGPTLAVEPRSEDAKALSKDRVAPLFRHSPALRGKLAAVKSRDSNNTAMHKVFANGSGHITFTGAISPSGKLTVTIPRSVGQLPCYYDHKPSRYREYVLSDSSPLYPFGFGLSYTAFEYSHLQISPKAMTTDGTAEISIDVCNTGTMKGDEIVQLYIHDLISLPTRPVKELKDFVRITLDPGEMKTVHFRLTPDKLAAIGMEMKRIVPTGVYEILAGKSSVDVLCDTLIVK